MRLPRAALAILAAGAFAQIPHLASVDYYGIRKVSRERIRKVVGVEAGDRLPGSKADLEDRLETIPGVVAARVEAVCCEEGRAMLFVGIEERGAPHFEFRSPPAGDVLLPESIVDTYHKFLVAVEAAARRGVTAEDLTQGHPLSADPDVRDYQQIFIRWVADNLDLTRRVLRNSADAGHRETAAALIGYARRKFDIVNDLQYAMQDPSEGVRANSIRALGALAVLAARDPKLDLKISPTWFIEMLNSIVLSDRYRAAAALVDLTGNDQRALAQVKERALPAVLEMAGWSALRYALPAYILAGRIAGLSSQEIEDTWSRGEREKVLKQAARGRK